MKKGRLILIGILCVMLGVIVYAGFFKKVDSPVKKENVLTSNKKKQEESSVPENLEEQEAHWNRYGENLPCAKNTLAVGQEFENDGLTFIVNSFEITKEAVDSDASYYIDENEAIGLDGDGNILNEFNYMVVNATITNKASVEKEFWFSAFNYVPIEVKTGQIAERYNTGQLWGYKTRNDPCTYEKSYYRQVFAPGQQYTGNLVFIQGDEGLTADEPYLFFNPQGILYAMDDDVKFVKLSR